MSLTMLKYILLVPSESIKKMYHKVLIQSSIDKHLGYIQFFAIIKRLVLVFLYKIFMGMTFHFS